MCSSDLAGGKLGTKFSFNVGGDVSYVDVDPLPAIGAPARSGWVVNGNASLNWQVTPKDLLQVNASSFGGQVTSSGEIEPFALLNLGYRHKFNDQWALIATVRDAADEMSSRAISMVWEGMFIRNRLPEASAQTLMARSPPGGGVASTSA